MKLPISKISELTGIHRDTVSKRLADLPFEAGKKGAKLYSSENALAAIYKTDSLEAARAEQARTAAQLNTIRAEDLRKTRIPIAIVLQVHDEIFQAIAATLKAAKGKLLTQELINDIFDKFRSNESKNTYGDNVDGAGRRLIGFTYGKGTVAQG